jgi:hypothetical protein
MATPGMPEVKPESTLTGEITTEITAAGRFADRRAVVIVLRQSDRDG